MRNVTNHTASSWIQALVLNNSQRSQWEVFLLKDCNWRALYVQYHSKAQSTPISNMHILLSCSRPGRQWMLTLWQASLSRRKSALLWKPFPSSPGLWWRIANLSGGQGQINGPYTSWLITHKWLFSLLFPVWKQIPRTWELMSNVLNWWVMLVQQNGWSF